MSHWLLGLFITQEAVRLQAEQLLHIMLWSLLLFGFQAVVGGIMRASGVVLVPVAISIACIVLVQVPAAYALDAWLGLEGVWMAFPITYAAMLALQTAYYKLVWKSQKDRAPWSDQVSGAAGDKRFAAGPPKANQPPGGSDPRSGGAWGIIP